MSARGLVLDIESALDRAALAQTGRSGPAAFSRRWLHRVVAVSTLSFTLDRAAGSFDDFGLETVLALDPAEEPELLTAVDSRLDALGPDGVLVTFNGHMHDLPVLVHRHLRHWMFAPSPLASFLGHGAIRHHDLMRQLGADDGARWPALLDVCAAFGIPCDGRVRSASASAHNPFLVKSQTDVAATFVLHCVCAAESAGSLEPLVRGWTALGDYVLAHFPRSPHLTQFATAPLALVARQSVEKAAR